MRKYRLQVLVALMLVTWAHFSDPPSGNAIRNDPRVVSTQQQPARPFSFFLMLMLVLRLFVMAFVISLAIVLGVILFVFCIANSCKWQLFVKLYGRTWTFNVKRSFLLLLLLSHSARIPFRSTRASPPNRNGFTASGFRDFAAVVHYKFLTDDVHAQIRKWLLAQCGDVEK